MAERPILFSEPMVCALLDGRKTQTRRALTQARVFGTPETRPFSLRGDDMKRALQNADGFQHLGEDGWFWESDAFEWQAPHTRTRWLAHIGYAPGDRLYVREEYYQRGHWEPVEGALTKGGKQKWAFVPADEAILFDAPEVFRKARHSADPATVAWHKRLGRFMPRAASRMTLIVTDVRVQRLQDCSEVDALAEGVPAEMEGDIGQEIYCPTCQGMGVHGALGHNLGVIEVDCADCQTAVQRYRNLWSHINGHGAWEANPWVVAVTFTVERMNIDAPGERDGGRG